MVTFIGDLQIPPSCTISIQKWLPGPGAPFMTGRDLGMGEYCKELGPLGFPWEQSQVIVALCESRANIGGGYLKLVIFAASCSTFPSYPVCRCECV